MLKFGRGIFISVVFSTFILLLVSFYPNNIDSITTFNQTKDNLIINNNNNNPNIINYNKIKLLCKENDIKLSINKILLENKNVLNIQYNTEQNMLEYSLYDSYKLAQVLFENYIQLNSINYTINFNNQPLLNASIDNNKYIGNSYLHTSSNILQEIQNAFSIILIKENDFAN